MVRVKTDAGAQTETPGQALYSPKGVKIKFLSFLYYIYLHIDANYFTPCYTGQYFSEGSQTAVTPYRLTD